MTSPAKEKEMAEKRSTAASTQQFWERPEAGESYDRDFCDTLGWYTNESELQPVVALLGGLRGKKILDVGCGTGRYLERLNPDNVLVGLDLSRSMLAAASKRVPHAVFHAGSAVNLPFPDQSFDVVYSVRVIQHIQEQEKMITEMKRVCKPGGQILLLAYNSWSGLNLYKQLRMSRAGRFLNLFFKPLLGRRSFLNPWGFEYDNYCSIPEIQGWFEKHGCRVTHAWGVTLGAPWFLNDFFIGKVLQKATPTFLRLWFRFVLVLDRTVAHYFPFRYFTDKVLVAAVCAS